MHIKITPRKLPKSIDQEKTIQEFNRHKYQQLLMCALIDGVSIFTDAIPALGQAGNLFASLIYGVAIFTIYRRRKWLAVIAAVCGVSSELVQGMDIVPVAMMTWVYVYIISSSKTLDHFFEEKRKNFDYLNNHYL